jgi:hypothetical protein
MSAKPRIAGPGHRPAWLHVAHQSPDPRARPVVLHAGRPVAALQADSTRQHQKDLDVTLASDRHVLILDDTEHVWARHRGNLIQVTCGEGLGGSVMTSAGVSTGSSAAYARLWPCCWSTRRCSGSDTACVLSGTLLLQVVRPHMLGAGHCAACHDTVIRPSIVGAATA